jgi:hypothetical protein
MFVFGVAPNRVDDEPEFSPGQRVADHRGIEYVYVEAGGEISPGALISFTSAEHATSLGIAQGLSVEDSRFVAAAPEAPSQPIVAGRFFWARTSDVFEGLDAREEA